MHPKVSVAVTLVLLGSAADAAAQPPARRTMTLDEVVAEALAHHPGVTAARADEDAAESRVDEARTSELPVIGVSAQINRSTGNTAPGAFFYAAGFPVVGGAPRGKSLDEGVWQTGVSLWASYDVLAFARQAARIDVSLAAHDEATAATAARRLDVAYRAADAFLVVLEARETVRASQASVERAQVLVTTTKTLTDQSLRPGADLARAEAEVAAAQTQVARAEQLLDVRRAQLAETMGDANAQVDPAPGALLGPVDDLTPPPAVPSPHHPDIEQSRAAVARASEAEHAVDVEYLPRVDLVAALWARGSGYYDSPAAGIVPDIPNWAAGAVVTWSLLDIPAVRARSHVATAGTSAAVARRDETSLAVSGELASTSAGLQGALRVAKQTGPTLAAARTSEQQASARFKTGLSPVLEEADAQRVLTQAEVDDAVARLEVRRALLALYRATGDLGPFLARAGGGAAR
jgi:outer membrane protein TolC